MAKSKPGKRLLIYLIGLFLIAGQLTLLPPDYAFGETDSQSASASGDTILAFTSDVHNNNDDVSADRLARWIGRIQSKYGKIDAMGFCGDMGNAGNGDYYWRNTQAVMDAVERKGVDGIYTTGNHEYDPGDIGNVTNSATARFKVDAEGKEGANYRIYCLGSVSKSQEYGTEQQEDLEEYLMGAGSDKPIIVLTHFPLHFCAGYPDEEKDRVTGNASDVIDLLNKAATNETPDDPSDDRKIIFLWGHNHTEYDNHYDQVFVPGESIQYAEENEAVKKIDFYYGGAGCMSDSEYSGGSASVKGKGLVMQIRSDGSLGFEYCDKDGAAASESGPNIGIDPGNEAVTGLSLDEDVLAVRVGRTARLTAKIEPINATNKSVIWTSSDESVAKVTPEQSVTKVSAKIRGISVGTARITATTADGGLVATAEVKVMKASTEHYYVIRIGSFAMSSRPSSEYRVNDQQYEYHGLQCIKYLEGDTAPSHALWRLEPVGNGYYIKDYEGNYLSASYVRNESDAFTGILTVGSKKDIWIPDQSISGWTASGSSLRSTNASINDRDNQQMYLAVTPGNSNRDFFTVRSISKAGNSILTEPEVIAEPYDPEEMPTPTPTPENGPGQTDTDKTAVGPGTSAAAAEQAITSMKSDKDPKGARYLPLKLRSTKQTKTSIKLRWAKVSKARKYVIYGNRCGKSYKPKKIATVTGSSKSLRKIAGKKIRKGTYYKFILVALDGDNNVVSTSKLIHVTTKGGRYTNHKAVRIKAKVRDKYRVVKSVSIKKGRSKRIKAKGVKYAPKKRFKKHVGLRFASGRKTIATISLDGVIKGKKKGTCYVYAYSQNGIAGKIKVVVK